VVDGVILYQMHGKAPWYFLKETHKTKVTARLAEPVPLHQKTQAGPFSHRLGQALEIAVMKALKNSGVSFLGILHRPQRA
jgi:hypothetical protein